MRSLFPRIRIREGRADGQNAPGEQRRKSAPKWFWPLACLWACKAKRKHRAHVAQSQSLPPCLLGRCPWAVVDPLPRRAGLSLRARQTLCHAAPAWNPAQICPKLFSRRRSAPAPRRVITPGQADTTPGRAGLSRRAGQTPHQAALGYRAGPGRHHAMTRRVIALGRAGITLGQPATPGRADTTPRQPATLG